jgi:hypothetical protein
MSLDVWDMVDAARFDMAELIAVRTDGFGEPVRVMQNGASMSPPGRFQS